MRHLKQILAYMLAASMMISGMTVFGSATEGSSPSSTQQVSKETDAAISTSDSDSSKAGDESEKTNGESKDSDKDSGEEIIEEGSSEDGEDTSVDKEGRDQGEVSEENRIDAEKDEGDSSLTGARSESRDQETAEENEKDENRDSAADTASGTDIKEDATDENDMGSSVETTVAPVMEETTSGEARNTMLPIQEKKAYLIIDSEDIDPSKVPLQTVFDGLMYGDGSKVKIDSNCKAVWAYVKDGDGKVIHDEYHEIQQGTTLDLSSISPSETTYTFELIVGDGVQLDYNATRYIVRVFLGSTQRDFVQYHLWKTDKNGKRSEIEPKDVVVQGVSGFGTSGSIRTFIISEMEEGDQYYVGVESLLDEHPLLNLRACGFEDFIELSTSGQISVGMMELGKGKEGIVNSDMSDPDNGFPIKIGTQQEIALSNALLLYYTDVYPDSGEEKVQVSSLNTIQFRVVTDAQSFEDEAFTVLDDEMVDVKFSTSATMLVDSFDLNENISSWNGYENVTHNRVILKKGYSADEEYYYALDAHSLIWEDANTHVVAAYNDWYHSLEEASEAGLKDIKDQLIPKDTDRNGIYGYKANYSVENGGQGFTVFFDDGTSFRFSVMFEEADPSLDYYMKDYDASPIVGSQDPWFHMTGMKLDDRELDAYIVENGKSINMDTYYGYGYQTVMVNEVLTEDEIARLVPIFEVGDPDRVEIRLPGSEKKLVSGQTQVDFSGHSSSTKDDDIANIVAIIDGHTKNYQVRVISKMDGPKLYVYDDYTDQGGDRFREVLLNDYFEEKHDILIANVGDSPLTGLKVRLELDKNANHVKLDDYWNIGGNGNDTLEPFTTTKDLSTFGMIPNIAKIRLIPDGEGDIEGKLIISADGQDDVVIHLSNHARQPEIINDNSQALVAVRWVPYSYIVATNNMYDWNEQTFSISEGELPPGMELNRETGEIYGAPTTEEERDYEYKFTVKATYSRDDYFQPSEKEFTILVRDNEDRTVYETSDDTYEIVEEEYLGLFEDQLPYIGEGVGDYRFEISSFDHDEVYVSRGDHKHFAKLWLNGEVLDEDAYETFDGSTVIVINREVLEEKSNKNGERNTISAEFDEEGNRGDDMKRTSQNYYVKEEEENKEQSDLGDNTLDEPEESPLQDTDSDDKKSGNNSETQTQPKESNTDQDGNETDSVSEKRGANGNSSGSNNGRSSKTSRTDDENADSTATTVTVNAKLVDATGTALSGYTLEMHSTVKKKQTNASGIAGFSGLEMGSHTVYVLNTSGDRLASEQFKLQQGTRFARNSNTFVVVPGQTVNMTLMLNGATLSITDVSTTGDVITGDTSGVKKWLYIFIVAALGIYTLLRLKPERK